MVVATTLGSGVAMIDATVVGIALPTIGRDFHSGLGPLQWVVTGYTLTLAALLLLGGSLGDHFGRKRVFMLGIGWFAVSSALCGLAPNSLVLIIFRTLQGVGGALLTPGSLAIIQSSFVEEDRGRAIGAWTGLGGVAAAAGPVLGGYLVTVSWRWIFFINLPVAALVLFMSAKHVPESRDPTASRAIDIPGTALGVASLASINYTLIEGSSNGWTSAPVLAAGALAVAATLSFVLVEKTVSAPMLPLDIFRDRQFSATNAVTFVVYGALGAAFFLVPIALQVVDRYSALESGLALIPVTVVMLLLSARSGRLASRIGPRLQMSLGPLVVAGGLALLTRAVSGPDYFEYVFPAVMVFAIGLAATVAPLTATAMSSAPAEHAGIASAVNNDVARIAQLLSVALLPWLAGIAGESYLHPHELAHGFRSAVLIAAAMCAAGGLVAAAAIRNRRPDAGIKAPAGAARDAFYCALDAPPLDIRDPVGVLGAGETAGASNG